MIDPFQVSVQGIGPGWTPFTFALQGFGFDIEIVIQPRQGGGSGPTLWDDALPYQIVVKISYKGKTWEEKKYISPLMAKSLEKVMASFKRMRVSTIEVFSTLNSIMKRTINVFVKRK